MLVEEEPAIWKCPVCGAGSERNELRDTVLLDRATTCEQTADDRLLVSRNSFSRL